MAGIAQSRLDDQLGPVFAEHLTDHFIIEALRSHPCRTTNVESADLHVSDALPFSSSVVEALGKNMSSLHPPATCNRGSLE